MERVRNKMLSGKRGRFLDMPSGIPNGKKKLTDEELKLRRKLRESSVSYKAKMNARKKSPEGKAKRMEYQRRPEVKAKVKTYRNTPEYKERRKLYERSPEHVAKDKEYRNRPEIRARIKLRSRLYSERPEVIKHREEYNKLTRSHRTRVQKARRSYLRYDVMMQLSNDDKPKCACCGLNEHIDFLSLDHVQGKREMDNIKEITDIGYSSKLTLYKLLVWIRNNAYLKSLDKKYFQILCHNCNFAKGMRNRDNTCPHQHEMLQ